jgi:hypothetical protein
MKHYSVIASLFAGIALVIQGGIGTLKADLTGVGSTVLAYENQIIDDGALHGAAFVPLYESAAAGMQLAVGVLLIVLGFFLHALFMAGDERRVRVHAVDKPKLVLQKQPQWFWIEMRM